MSGRQETSPVLHVSSLRALPEVAARLGRFDLLTLLSPDHAGEDHRSLASHRHLELSFHDVVVPTSGLIAPDRAIVRSILDFGRGATPDHPILIHCWAGISRSSAAAFMMVCDGNPGFERAIADELRRRAPSVTPNRLMVALADDLMGRRGHMVDAIDRIGRGADAFEGAPYQLPLRWPGV